LLSIMNVEPNLLSISHRHLKFILNFIDYTAVLETVCLQLIEGCVFSRLFRFGLHFFTHACKSLPELFHSNFSILIQIKFRHEHGNFFFKWGESVSFIQKIFNFIRSNAARLILVHPEESGFKLFVRENVQAKSRTKASLKRVGRTK
jgi:hypothetical protein